MSDRLSDPSRRTVLALAAAAPLLPQAVRAAAPAPADPAVARGAGLAPREVLPFDTGWRFALGHGSDPAKDFDFGYGQSDFAKTGDFKLATTDFDDSDWRALDLPHDWAVELPFVHDDRGNGDANSRSHGYKPLGRRYPETSIGWYRRRFDVPASDRGRRTWIEFDGAMRDVILWVNGCYIGRHNDGYTPFRFDLSDFLHYGGDNVIVVRVDASLGDGWFYEGAGLYRHVWLTKHDAVHFGKWESVVRATPEGKGATLDLATVIANESDAAQQAVVEWTIANATGEVVARASAPAVTVAAGGTVESRVRATLPAATRWSTETPALYTATARLAAGGSVRDADRVTFGVRSFRFDADHGFFLNDKPMKLQGTCNHQDHAGVGAALPDAIQRYRLNVLREMGCNAVRTTHNMPTPEWVEECDRAGVLVMCEARQMSSNPEAMAQLEVMVKRFRNSPSVILWSIGNEEWLLQKKMAEQGKPIATAMVRRCHALDPTRPVSAAVNDDNEQGVSDPLDIIGFNYHQEYPEAYHAKHPTRPIYGSETSSAISTRGEYSSDKTRNTVNSYDGVVGWGKTPEDWWKLYGGKEWSAGGFAWTGFDYRGEPTPYGWPSINSQFGIVDMCGFPKDYYYYYRAWWRAEPSLHLFPHWNWEGREGETVSVWVYSNCDTVELLVNGRSMGTQSVPPLGHLEWKVPYQPGAIEARGRKGGRVLTERRETTGPGRTIRLTADRPTIQGDGRDVAMLKAELLDARGRPIPTAMDKLAFTIQGPGAIIGVGNGDPNCLESDKEPRRSLFNGLAQVIVQSTGRSGTITVSAVADGPRAEPLLPGKILVRAARPGI
nr:beta-galactosidase GalA [uncultured Sphingomonas sp.]